MSSQPYEIPSEPERDRDGGDNLPTYDDLLVQNGPNSRFGRWKEWIEKRAAERYADLTPDALKQRRAKGWGASTARDQIEVTDELSCASSAMLGPPLRLQLQTSFSSNTVQSEDSSTPVNLAPQPSIGEPINPSHLELHQFGSRFLPHTTSPIRCLLPLLGDRLMLIGHDDGLSVMDMYPTEWGDHGLAHKGPSDAEARPIWVGEGVFQMNILESESTGEGTPQGVILALVGPESSSPKEQEGVRSLRMYNLASLVSLAKYSVVQKSGSHPLDLRHPTSGKPVQTTPRKHHRKGPSLAKGFKNLMVDSPPTGFANTAYQSRSEGYAQLPSAIDSPSSGTLPLHSSPVNDSTIDSSWDMVDDLPLRWATDFVPLATTGSRLGNLSVLSYALYRDENQRSRGGAFLAVSVKSNILLYETPKGERAFRFVKEFYTPITARSLTFVHQTVLDSVARSPSDISHSRHHLATPTNRHLKRLSMGGSFPSHPQYPPQLSIFVVFEKKAGLIRIADSAVGEVDLFDETSGPHALLSPLGASVGSLGRKPRSSWDGRSFLKENKASWIPPVRIVIPGQSNEGWTSASRSMYLLTRGKHSNILPYPLPSDLPSIPPFRTFTWSSPPSQISTRICRPRERQDGSSSAFLQVIAFGEEGVEVQEIPLSSITVNTSKGKGKAEDPVHAVVDIGGDTGFLCTGGHWHDDPAGPHFTRSDSAVSYDSVLEDISSSRTPSRLREREGVYGWVRRGVEDWRVFWVGGTGDRSTKAYQEFPPNDSR